MYPVGYPGYLQRVPLSFPILNFLRANVYPISVTCEPGLSCICHVWTRFILYLSGWSRFILYLSRVFFDCGVWCIADVSSVSTSSEQKYTISTFVDQTHIQLTRQHRNNSVYPISVTCQARSQPVFSGKPEGPFCLSCSSIFRNERNWMEKSARVSEKLVSPGLPGLQVATIVATRLRVNQAYRPISVTCEPGLSSKQNIMGYVNLIRPFANL